MSTSGVTPPADVGFLGMGLMGGYMAANLAKAGFTVNCWNRTPDRPGCRIAEGGGARMVGSIKEAVTNSKVVFTCVGEASDVEEVVLGDQGVCKFATEGILIVDTSTIGRSGAKSIGEKVEKKGFRFVDAPISGGDIGAKEGTLTIMVGAAKEEDFQELMPCFNAMGKNIVLCGGVGNGQAVKLCNQVLCGINMVGICEALTLAEKQQIDPNLIVEVCSSGAAGSWALSNLAPRIIKNDLNPGFMIKHMLKDLGLVQHAAHEVDQPLPGVSLSEHLFKDVAEMGGEELGTQAMIYTFNSKRS